MSTTQYLLKNQYSSNALAVDPTAPSLQLRASSPNDVALDFLFTELAGGLYNICTTYKGFSYCLDVFGDNKTTPHLGSPGSFTGQMWSVIPANGFFKLSNQYTGSGYFLDVYGDTKQGVMSTGDYSGQYWDRVVVSAAIPSSSLSQTVRNKFDFLSHCC